jgi:hypothetical protein
VDDVGDRPTAADMATGEKFCSMAAVGLCEAKASSVCSTVGPGCGWIRCDDAWPSVRSAGFEARNDMSRANPSSSKPRSIGESGSSSSNK